MKYYQPELEEFHVGFEYEIFEDWDIQPEKTWHSQIYGSHGINPENMGYVSPNVLKDIRVKYLDEQDIKDLGWELQGETPSPYTGKPLKTFKITKQVGFNTGSDYYLETTDSNKIMITIFEYSSYGGGKEEMSFTIKNKSELKKLMKQLGIIQ